MSLYDNLSTIKIYKPGGVDKKEIVYFNYYNKENMISFEKFKYSEMPSNFVLYYDGDVFSYYLNIDLIKYSIYDEPIISINRSSFRHLTKSKLGYSICVNYDFDDKLTKGIIKPYNILKNLNFIDDL